MISIKRQSGFTLIELLVVIAIIGIILALSIFGLQGARRDSRDAKRKSDLEAIRAALELYRADCNQYPTNAIFPAVGSSLTGTDALGIIGCSSSIVYLQSRPGDPLNTAGRYYAYNRSSNNLYSLCASLEGSTGGHIATCGSATACGNGLNCNYQLTNP